MPLHFNMKFRYQSNSYVYTISKLPYSIRAFSRRFNRVRYNCIMRRQIRNYNDNITRCSSGDIYNTIIRDRVITNNGNFQGLLFNLYLTFLSSETINQTLFYLTALARGYRGIFTRENCIKLQVINGWLYRLLVRNVLQFNLTNNRNIRRYRFQRRHTWQVNNFRRLMILTRYDRLTFTMYGMNNRMCQVLLIRRHLRLISVVKTQRRNNMLTIKRSTSSRLLMILLTYYITLFSTCSMTKMWQFRGTLIITRTIIRLIMQIRQREMIIRFLIRRLTRSMRYINGRRIQNYSILLNFQCLNGVVFELIY